MIDRLGPYELNRIYTGDARVLSESIPDESVDLIFTSPPYNLGISSGGGLKGAKKSGKWRNAKLANGYNRWSDDLPIVDYISWQKNLLLEFFRIIKPNGAIYYNHKPRVQNGLLITPLDFNPGLPIRQIVIWKRSGGINFATTHYVPTHEWIVIFAKPDFRLKSKAASGAGDVWEVHQEVNNDHPAPFPVKLPLRAIETVDPDIVFDPFIGSGTTAVAATKWGCKYLGFEIDPETADLARQRVAQTQPPLPIVMPEQLTLIPEGESQ